MRSNWAWLGAICLFAMCTSAGAIDNNVHLPAPGPNGCAAGYKPGTDEVIYTIAYSYRKVLSIIGNYTDLTWSGIPKNSVTTNNSLALRTNFWTPRTARFYTLAGADVVETITKYSKKLLGPYVEVHTLAPITIAAEDNLTAYAAFDGQVWTPICGGKAVRANFTTKFCATNVVRAGELLHSIHLTDAQAVSEILGGRKFKSCGDLRP